MRKVLSAFVVLAGLALGLGVFSVCAWQALAAEKEKEEDKEVKVKLSECPEAVQKAFARESQGAKKSIETVDKETDKTGAVIYEADVVLGDGKNYEIIVAADGSLISKKLDPEDEKGEGDKKKEKDDDKDEKK